MPAQQRSPQSSHAEKRVLWEVRQRYNVASALNRPRSARRPASTRRETARHTPPPRPPSGPPRQPLGHSASRGRWLGRLALLVVIVLVVSGGVFGYKILAASNKITVAERSIVGQLKDLLFSQGKELQGESSDRINILLAGVGGAGHQGQDLADTIMIASIRPADNRVALLSIPRDMYVQVPGESYYTKINGVHAYGESQKKDTGLMLLAEVVEQITGQPIHYYGRADFIAFKEIVEAVGGVTITIDNSFFDYWHKIAFSAGTEKMDGERALAYVRARYIEGPEGGDFKRAARQQQVLLALRDKVFSVNTALDFSALNNILNAVSDNIRTDMQLWEMKRFYEFARQIDRDNIHSVVLSTGTGGVLVGTTEILGNTPASVLKPRTGDYSEIHALAAAIFDTDDQAVTVAEPAPDAPPETDDAQAAEAKPTVEVRNGTNVTGLAAATAERLTAEGYEVLTIGNATDRSRTTTTVYTLDQEATDGAKKLGEFLAAATDSGLPDEEPASRAQVLIILGTDQGD